MVFSNYTFRMFLIVIPWIIIFSTIAEASPHHDDDLLLGLNPHVHLNLHENYHLLRVRNVLLGISGTIAIIVAACFAYRYYTSTGGMSGLGATFSERGTLLPSGTVILEPGRYRHCWPFSFFNQPGMTFSRFSTPSSDPVLPVYYNRTAAPYDKAFSDPWEHL